MPRAASWIAGRFGRDLPRSASKIAHLALDDPLVGAEHFLFVFLQRRRHEALAAGDRLLAVVIRRNVREIRLRDLDVVPEDAVVADLQRADAGPRALRLFHRGDVLLAGTTDRAQLVELGVHAVADHAAVARDRRWFIEQRGVEVGADVREIVDLGEQAEDQRRLQLRRAGASPAGCAAIDCLSDTRSRGPAVPSAARATSRSMS